MLSAVDQLEKFMDERWAKQGHVFQNALREVIDYLLFLEIVKTRAEKAAKEFVIFVETDLKENAYTGRELTPDEFELTWKQGESGSVLLTAGLIGAKSAAEFYQSAEVEDLWTLIQRYTNLFLQFASRNAEKLKLQPEIIAGDRRRLQTPLAAAHQEGCGGEGENRKIVPPVRTFEQTPIP